MLTTASHLPASAYRQDRGEDVVVHEPWLPTHSAEEECRLIHQQVLGVVAILPHGWEMGDSSLVREGCGELSSIFVEHKHARAPHGPMVRGVDNLDTTIVANQRAFLSRTATSILDWAGTSYASPPRSPGGGAARRSRQPARAPAWRAATWRRSSRPRCGRGWSGSRPAPRQGLGSPQDPGGQRHLGELAQDPGGGLRGPIPHQRGAHGDSRARTFVRSPSTRTQSPLRKRE